MTTAKIRTAFLAVVTIAIVTTFVLFLGTDRYDAPHAAEIVQLDSGWTISRGSDTWKTDDLPNESIGIMNTGDSVTITSVLPMAKISPATIFFKSYLSTVDAYLDDELIYSFGQEYVDKELMLPKMMHFIQLPDGYQGKELKITFTAWEENAYSGLTPVRLGIYNDLKNSLVQGMRLPTVIGVYLCHLGFMLLIMAPFLAFSKYHDYSTFFSGLSSLAMGIYILCYNDAFWYLADNAEFYTFTEYFSLFMIPAVCMGFVLAAGQSSFKLIGNGLMVFNLMFVFGTTALHLANIVHICHFVPVLHILGLAECVFVIASLVYKVIKTTQDNEDQLIRTSITSTQTLILGLMIFLVCALIDIVSFNVLKFVSKGEANARIDFMTFGALVFIMSLLLHYFYHCIEFINESTAKIKLEGLAYSDTLTGISNRARCEQTLAELSGDYTIISMDLDYLKYTNDNFGHDMGDKLLSGFTDILSNTFTDASLIGRMGGDEFIVVLPFVDEQRTGRDLANFADQLEHKNSEESVLRFSASWGCASSKDKSLKNGAPAQKVYLLADQRMYAMKNQHHKQTLGRLYDDLLGKILEKGGDGNEEE